MDILVKKIGLAVQSRTVWTLVILFAVNGIQGISSHIPTGFMPIVDAVLGLATIYFHVNPRQNYN